MLDLFANHWEEILSHRPARIRAAFLALDEDGRAAVLAHLKKMAGEPGWHPAQVESATIALQALDELND